MFVIPFETGVCVITHWKIHNYIQSDRYKETLYTDEKSQLQQDENGMYTRCIQNVSKVEAQVRLGKGRLVTSIFLVNNIYNNNQEFFNLVISKNDNYIEFIKSFIDKGLPEKIVIRELDKFTSYWTEKNSTGKKQRWQMEKTFEVEKRLVTWFSRVKEFKGSERVGKNYDK